MCGTGLVVAVVLLAFRDLLLPLFTRDAAVLGQAEVALAVPGRTAARPPAWCSPWHCSYGAGDVGYLRMNSSIGSAVVGFLPLSLLAGPMHWGLAGVWTGFIGLRLAGVLTRGPRARRPGAAR